MRSKNCEFAEPLSFALRAPSSPVGSPLIGKKPVTAEYRGPLL